jgi:hypothetical protein
MLKRNFLNIIMEEPNSQNAFFEGAKLISNWFYFTSDREVNLTALLDVEICLQTIAETVKRVLLRSRDSQSTEDILKAIDQVLLVEMGLRAYNAIDSIKWNHPCASIHNVCIQGSVV